MDTEVWSVGVINWVVTGVWTVVLVNGGVVSWVVTGCGQWVRSVKGQVGVVTGGGQWCVVSHQSVWSLGTISGCFHWGGQWMWSVGVVNEGVVSWCGQWVQSVDVVIVLRTACLTIDK